MGTMFIIHHIRKYNIIRNAKLYKKNFYFFLLKESADILAKSWKASARDDILIKCGKVSRDMIECGNGLRVFSISDKETTQFP